MGKLVDKLIKIDQKDKDYLEKKANEMGMTSNQLIRILIKEFIKKEG